MEGDLFAPKRKSVACCVTPCLAPPVPDCSFHSFPTEPDVRKRWQQALCIDEVNDGMKVCGGHFTADDFFPTCAFKVRKLNVKRLKRTAVPSLFLPSALLEEDALRIVKVEASEPECISEDVCLAKKPKFENEVCEIVPLNDVKTELDFVPERGQYSIETFCCTTCGLTSNTEALFLEHLGTHVKKENQNFNLECDQDPVDTCLPEDSGYAVIGTDDDTFSFDGTLAAGPTEESLSCNESSESEDSDDEDFDDFDGASEEEGDEEFRKFLSSDSKFLDGLINNNTEHVCFLCKRSSRVIKMHITSHHPEHPAIQDIWIHKPISAERRRRVRRLILIGDFRAQNKGDRLVKAFCRVRSREAFEDFMRRRLHLLDERLREFVFGIFKERQIIRERLDDFSPFSKRRLFRGDGLWSVTIREWKHKCSYCDFCTDHKPLAMAHFQLHSEGKSFGCHCCQRYFDSFESLMSSHTAVSACTSIRLVNFQLRCDFCWGFFSSRKEYIWHVISGYCLSWCGPCDLCNARVFRRHLPTHMKNVHSDDSAASWGDV